MKYTKDELISRLKAAANGRYTFIKSSIKSTQSRVYCKCSRPDCRFEWHTGYQALVHQKTGCPKCSGRYKLSVDEVNTRLSEALTPCNITFKPLVTYKNNKQHIECECECGHKWSPNICGVLNKGSRCRKCSHKKVVAMYRKKPIKDTMKELEVICKERNMWVVIDDLSTLKGVQRVLCVCKGCGDVWRPRLGSLLYANSGCKKCGYIKVSQARLLDINDVNKLISEKFKDRVEYDKLKSYKGVKQKIKCTCKKCNEVWYPTIHRIIYANQGCPNECFVEIMFKSVPEYEIINYIKENYPNLEVQQSARNLIRNPKGTRFMELDIYIPEIKLAFEFNGTYWHSDERIQMRTMGKFQTAQQYHDYKTAECEKLGIKLIHIDENDWVKDKQNVLRRVYSDVQTSKHLG